MFFPSENAKRSNRVIAMREPRAQPLGEAQRPSSRMTVKSSSCWRSPSRADTEPTLAALYGRYPARSCRSANTRFPRAP